MNLDDLYRRGKKKGLSGYIVNPLRRFLFALIHPYLSGLVEEGNYSAKGRAGESLTMNDLSDELEALSKEVEAMNFRFSTIERKADGLFSNPSLYIHKSEYGTFALRRPDIISDHIRNGGFWDSHLKDVIQQYADKDAIAIDCGAYLGFHSCYMSRFFREVYSFEPQYEMFRMLEANLLFNECRNVKSFLAALYDRRCTLSIAPEESQEIKVPQRAGAIDYERITNAAALTLAPATMGNGCIPGVRLDDLLLESVAFVKVDCQGSDLRVLQGARETIAASRPVIVFEFEEHLSKGHGIVFSDYEDFFSDMGYSLEVLKRTNSKQCDYIARYAGSSAEE